MESHPQISLTYTANNEDGHQQNIIYIINMNSFFVIDPQGKENVQGKPLVNTDVIEGRGLMITVNSL